VKFRYFASSKAKTIMEATFVARPSELKDQLLEKIELLFAGDDRPVTVTLKRDDQPRYDPKEVLKHMKETRQKYPPKQIPADIDINKLIDEMYWEGNH
jgi:hypothetical protein